MQHVSDMEKQIPIEAMCLSIRTYNALKQNGVYTFSDLILKTDSELLSMKGFGRRCLSEVRMIKLNGFGSSIKMYEFEIKDLDKKIKDISEKEIRLNKQRIFYEEIRSDYFNKMKILMDASHHA